MRSLGQTTEDSDTLHFYDSPELAHRQMTFLLKAGDVEKLELVCKHALVRSPFDAIAWFHLGICLVFFQKEGDIAEKQAEGMGYLRHAAQMKNPDAGIIIRALEQYAVSHPEIFTIPPQHFHYFLDDFRVKYSATSIFPSRFLIETQTVCNAKCKFCLYHDLDRKNVRMSNDLLDKIIAEMKTIPIEFGVNFDNISEPFADKRIFDLYDTVNRDIPNAFLHIFSNGSLLTAERQHRLFPLHKARLNISLNESNTADYEEVMGLSFKKVVDNLDSLHKNVRQGHLRIPITVSRVSNGDTKSDAEFQQFVRERYPLFKCDVKSEMDVTGLLSGNDLAPFLPCRLKYFSVVFSTGEVNLCCADYYGGILNENAHEKSLLEIYNGPKHKQYRNALSARDLAPCNICRAVSPFES